MESSKEEAYFNDVEAWKTYCQRFIMAGSSHTSYDALRIAVPALYESIANVTKRWGAPIDAAPQDTACLAETRIPIMRATEAIWKAASEKDVENKRRYLELAKKWLETPHPLQGNQTQKAVNDLLNDIRISIETPSKLADLASKLKRKD